MMEKTPEDISQQERWPQLQQQQAITTKIQLPSILVAQVLVIKDIEKYHP